MLRETLQEVINSKPDTIQFAKDRKYEESWIIPCSGVIVSDQKIAEYLEKEPFKLLVVEYLWNSQDDANRFVLTVFLDQSCVLRNPIDLIKTSLDIFYGCANFTTALDSIDSELIGKPYLLRVPVELVNMSIFNHWLSVGPVDLWEVGDAYDKSLMSQKIKARPEIASSKLNYQGLLFRFNVSGKYSGPHFGIKTPCCQKSGDAWNVDYKLVDYWMRKMLSIDEKKDKDRN
jgi:hypothetical protein